MIWLPTAIVAAGLAAGLLALVLGYLALIERRNLAWRYWCGAYLLECLRFTTSAWVVAQGGFEAGTPFRLALIGVMVLLVLGIFEFTRQRGHRLWLLLGTGVLLCWEVVARMVGLPPMLASTPPSLAFGGVLIWVGYSFWPKRGDDRPRSRLLALVLMALGVHLIEYPVFRQIEWFAPYGFLIAQALMMSAGVLLVIVSLRDRSDRLLEAVAEAQRARRELEASRNRMADFARASSDWFWETDTEGRISFILENRQNLFGIPVADVIGRTRRELPTLHAEDETWHRYEALMAAREPFADLRFEERAADGTPRSMSLAAHPIFDEAGRFIGYRGVGRDITEQLKTEEHLGTIHSRLIRTLESRSEGVAFFDNSDRFVLCNETYRRHVGRHHSLLQPGLSFEAFLRAGMAAGGFDAQIGENAENAEDWLEWRLERHADPPTSFEFRRLDGGWTLAREQRTDDGGWLITTTDITELKEREDQLRNAVTQAELANRGKMEFLATMSHELRTPLNAIVGFSDVIRAPGMTNSPSKAAEYAGYIHESGVHLLSVINDLLDVARIEAGQFSVNARRFEWCPLVQECERMIGHRAREAGIELLVSGPQAPIEIVADRRALKQVLLNLLSNAVKFTPRGGTVEVSSRRSQDDVLVVSVSDTGVGVPPDRVAEIFEPFRQIEHVHARRFQGTGLGLFISKNLIEAHGGAITLGPREDGPGTVVTVRLPTETESRPLSVERSRQTAS